MQTHESVFVHMHAYTNITFFYIVRHYETHIGFMQAVCAKDGRKYDKHNFFLLHLEYDKSGSGTLKEEMK